MPDLPDPSSTPTPRKNRLPAGSGKQLPNMNPEVEEIEIFYQNTTEQIRPFAPNNKAVAIQSQL